MPLLKCSILSFSLAVSLSGCQQDVVARSPANAGGSAPQVTPAATALGAASFDVDELNSSINACQDLNGFVNGAWIKANPIPPDRVSWGVIDRLVEHSLEVQRALLEDASTQADPRTDPLAHKLGLLYAAGMDDATIEAAGFKPIQPQLEAIAALSSGKGVADYITQEHAQGSGQVFDFNAGADFRDASVQIAFATEAGLGLPTKEYYTAAQYAQARADYLAYIAHSFELTGSPADTAKAEARDVMALETRLAHASLAPTEARAPENQYHFVSLAEAEKATPHFSWKAFFAAQGLGAIDGFSLSQPRFFSAFDHELATAPITQWRAYLRFHLIDDASGALSKAFVDNSFAFHGKALGGQLQQRPRWRRTLSAVNRSMDEALARLYVAKTFSPEAKQRATELVENLRGALRARIERVDWMSPQTKSRALAKWEGLLPKIGYPQTWRDWSGLEIVPGDYYRNLQAAARFNHQYDLAQIGKPTDRNRWSMMPQTVDAFYEASTNAITLPAAIMQPPFFDANADDALNYGAVGSVIGHEFTHGFDDKGSKFDGAGNNLNWWLPPDRKAFEQRAAKLVDQFDTYVPMATHPELHVNGRLTLGENIADLGGLNIAYDALQTALRTHPERARTIDGYGPDQRFFLAFARNWRGHVREQQAMVYLASNPHAPSALRANGPPSNMPQFAQAFSCKPGDAMVRPDKDRVVIW